MTGPYDPNFFRYMDYASIMRAEAKIAAAEEARLAAYSAEAAEAAYRRAEEEAYIQEES